MVYILLALFPLAALIALGYCLKQLHFLKQEFWDGAERINYYIFFPALFVHLLATAKIQFSAVQGLLSAMLLIFVLALVGLYGFKKLAQPPRARYGVYVQSIVRFNSYMSLALVGALYQQSGMAMLAILLAVGVPLVNIIAVLSFTDLQQMNVAALLRSLLKNPLISSCMFGLILNILAIPLWQGLLDLLKLLSAASLPLGLLCVGAALQFKHMRQNLSPLLGASLARLVAMPCLAYLVCWTVKLSPLESQVLVLFFAIPTASAAYILTKVLKGDSQLMAAVISTQTLSSAFTLPLILFWIA